MCHSIPQGQSENVHFSLPRWICDNSNNSEWLPPEAEMILVIAQEDPIGFHLLMQVSDKWSLGGYCMVCEMS